ncbi:hypothetical protein LX81_01345 [Palleronia aestuarii]|uniref:Uncharacterized protein n=1 Tax=Palleronia aestuarii TaxID=568105 RepID=A0A2W7NCC2_9RHOB|nr:hypothetical protein [Palleronia aestuarii]PZX17620.1 hypothetical protein LX81_01345 [Palleronia aestuarii]
MAPKLLPLAAFLCLAALPAPAQDVCAARVNSSVIEIDRESLDAPRERPGLRERVTGWPALGLRRVTGSRPSCGTETLIAYLSDTVPADEIAAYCLFEDDTEGYLLVPGTRDRRGRCAATTCDRVNAAAGGVKSVAGTAVDIATGRDADRGESRTSAVLHASGAAIVTGSATSLLSSLGTGIGTATTAALTAPVLAGAAAVSAVAVGGALYICH